MVRLRAVAVVGILTTAELPGRAAQEGVRVTRATKAGIGTQQQAGPKAANVGAVVLVAQHGQQQQLECRQLKVLSKGMDRARKHP